MPPFVLREKIRFDEIDGAGIVYYPQYFKLCHAAFEDLFDARAPVPYAGLIRERRLGFPTVSVHGDFFAPLAYGDVAVVTLTLASMGTSSVVLDSVIRRERDGVRCFAGRITTVLVELEAMRSLPLPDELRALFAGLAEDVA